MAIGCSIAALQYCSIAWSLNRILYIQNGSPPPSHVAFLCHFPAPAPMRYADKKNIHRMILPMFRAKVSLLSEKCNSSPACHTGSSSSPVLLISQLYPGVSSSSLIEEKVRNLLIVDRELVGLAFWCRGAVAVGDGRPLLSWPTRLLPSIRFCLFEFFPD